MILVKKIDESVYQVTESFVSFFETKISRWYYDTKRMLISEKPNFPDSMLTRKMDEHQYDNLMRWIKKGTNQGET